MQATVVLKASAGAGIVLGALSIVAGSRVLAGIDRPDYVVLPALVAYNVAAGLAGVVAGAGLWRLRAWAAGLAWTLAAAHGAVLLFLIAWWIAGRPVAADSLGAMLLRSAVWTGIAVVAGRAGLAARGGAPRAV